MATRSFHIGDILSITTGCLVSPRHMEGIYDILGFMAGENLMTHQLPRVSDEMKARLLAQHPQLVNIPTDGVNGETWQEWLAKQAETFGETLPVEDACQFHEIKDPISEAEDMVGKDRVMVIVC